MSHITEASKMAHTVDVFRPHFAGEHNKEETSNDTGPQKPKATLTDQEEGVTTYR